MALSAACLHFPSCMLSLLANVWLCTFVGSSFSRAKLHVPFQAVDVHSFCAGIPTGAPVAASPLETSAISLCMELKNDARGGNT